MVINLKTTYVYEKFFRFVNFDKYLKTYKFFFKNHQKKDFKHVIMVNFI